MPTPQVEISVVMPCRNGESTISRQLDALSGQACDGDWEVIVADNGSTDESARIVRSYVGRVRNLRLIDANETPGINHARNAGIRASTGEFIVFCDVDDVVQPGWLAAFLREFREGAALVGGAIVRVTLESGTEGSVESGLRRDLRFLPWPQGANCGFARRVYESVGGLDEGYLGGGDETDFFWKAQLAGYDLVEVQEARVYYSQREALSGVFRQHHTFGRSHVRLYKRFGALGMPRSSNVQAARAWLSLILQLVLSPARPEIRRPALIGLAHRTGRLRESFYLGVWYP